MVLKEEKRQREVKEKRLRLNLMMDEGEGVA